jgi:RNA polymerase sigma factor (sigma-70 family)
MTKQLTDEQRALAEENIGLAHHMAHKLKKRTPLDFEDILLICYEQLVESAKRFEYREGGIQFSTYTCMNMQNRVFSEARRKYRPTESIEEMGYKIEPHYPPIEEIVCCKIAIRQALQNFKGSQREKAVAIKFVQNPDLTQKELGELTGTSQVLASRAIAKLRAQLQEEMTG